ncbi:MAG: diaminopimelate epimerase [Alphaproteobacteria bacterium]|nr:diaminopimelate epimerase [Alphaproteobacteria bacterium]
MTALRFRKMHGLGNDFVLFDARARAIDLTPALRRAIAERRRGVGCDQIITIERSRRADALMRVHNADGDEVEACGNGTRCVADLLMAETGRDRVAIETAAGILVAAAAGAHRVAVDMGRPRFAWDEIPLARPMDTLHLDLQVGPVDAPVLADPVAVNVGNPHAVFFVFDVAAIDLAHWGPKLETDPLFPARANISIATVLTPEALRLRVWERGVGITEACGTAACAALVAACRRGLCARSADVVLDGGPLRIDWREDEHVVMTGPVAESFAGTLDPETLAAAEPSA